MFARGNEERTMEFKNCSREFFNFINHLQFIRDTDSRKKLVYIDSNEYWRQAVMAGNFEHSILQQLDIASTLIEQE
jgi:hypothetical protein